MATDIYQKTLQLEFGAAKNPYRNETDTNNTVITDI